MWAHSNLLLVVALAPSLALAQASEKPLQRATAWTIDFATSNMRAELAKREQIKARVLSLTVGIEAIKSAALVLHEFTRTSSFPSRDARNISKLIGRTSDLTDQTAGRLLSIEGLTPAARIAADSAALRLSRSRLAARRIAQMVARRRLPISRPELDYLRAEAIQLHADVVYAGRSVQDVADAYNIDIDASIRPPRPGVDRSTDWTTRALGRLGTGGR